MTKKTTRGSGRQNRGRRGDRRPFLCVVSGDGIDVDIRVEDSRSIRAIAAALGDGLGQVLGRAARGVTPDVDPPDLVDLATVALTGTRAPDDAELDQVIEVLQRERDRRAELRS